MMQEGQIKKLLQQAKLLRKVKHTGSQQKEKTPIGRNKSKDVGERRATQKLPWKGQRIQTKQEILK